MKDVTNVVGKVVNVAETVTETAALAYLASMASSKDVTNVNIDMSKLLGRTTKIVAVRVMLLCLLLLVLYTLLKQYIFTFILKVEEGNDRPKLNYVMVALSAVVMTFIFRKYVYIAHSATIRQSFKKKVLKQLGEGPQMEDFKVRFHSIDHSRIAI